MWIILFRTKNIVLTDKFVYYDLGNVIYHIQQNTLNNVVGRIKSVPFEEFIKHISLLRIPTYQIYI